MRQDYSLNSTGRGKRPRRPIEIMMTPMIDVIFLLLVFFLATSSFQVVEQLLPSGVSETKETAGNSAEPPTDPTDDAIEQVVVKLSRQADSSVISINSAVLTDFAELRNRLQTLSQARADVPVIIDPDGEVPASDVIRAYDGARQIGLSRVYLATRSK